NQDAGRTVDLTSESIEDAADTYSELSPRASEDVAEEELSNVKRQNAQLIFVEVKDWQLIFVTVRAAQTVQSMPKWKEDASINKRSFSRPNVDSRLAVPRCNAQMSSHCS
ncbi:MAG: hypothetical protein SGPRY_001609, partial [Prymnesium sp.]